MNPRKYNQIESALQVLDKSFTVDILRGNEHLLFLFKKTERVVAATYVITSLFPDVEPLKWRLREASSRIIGHILSHKERSNTQSKEFVSDTLAEIAHLLSLLDLAYVAELLSSMNFLILKKEIEIIFNIIDGKARTSSPTQPPFLDERFFALSKDMFDGAGQSKDELALSVSAETKAEESPVVRSFGEFERLRREREEFHKGQKIKDNVFYKKLPDTVKAPNALSVPRTSPIRSSSDNQIKEERRKDILGVLRDGRTATIKDFSSVISGCSEKTVQRLLIEMVRDGILQREGDRRWSRYSILKHKEISSNDAL
ncbi:MAG: hypothetical protein Q7R93_03040 [bacterium]|nr:hypothetical protein [bacterium]